MNSIDAGLIPPPRGLEREEPELRDEDDIPADEKKADGDRWARGETD